jgi:hypothetical protein
MKFNWGTGIVLSFILFAGSILFIILVPFNQEVDLVTKDYYDKEIVYQQQIDRTDRTERLKEEIKIEHNSSLLNINFPVNYGSVSGEILFYRPSDAKKDFIKEIVTDNSNSQVIDISRLEPGLWKVRVNWNMKEQSYYFEKIIMI